MPGAFEVELGFKVGVGGLLVGVRVGGLLVGVRVGGLLVGVKARVWVTLACIADGLVGLAALSENPAD